MNKLNENLKLIKHYTLKKGRLPGFNPKNEWDYRTHGKFRLSNGERV